MPSPLQPDFQSARSPGLLATESISLPVRLSARDCGQSPERAAQGRKGGVSAAIWSGQKDGPTEYRRAALADFHVLSVRLGTQRVERWHDGERISDEDPRPGASTLLRAGVTSRLVVYGAFRSFQFFLPTSLVEHNASVMGVESRILERLRPGMFYDAAIDHLGAKAVLEIEENGPGSALQLDAIGAILCVHLLRRAAGAQAYRPWQGGLTGWQVRRIKDCIAARLHENPSLASLAREVGLSQYHFVRAFKQSTGQSPHQYLLRCRLERAKEMLARTDDSIADIAARVGYDDPTQLARLFRMELDITPSAYRKAVPARMDEDLSV
jgi:AraC family transcriptional regulator